MLAFRSIIALIGGFAIMAFLVIPLVALTAWAFGVRAGAPTTAFIVANLVVSAIAAFVGGYSTAALAPMRPRAHTVGLAVMVLAMAVSSVFNPQPGQPRWYLVTLAVVAPLVALAGGFARRPRAAGAASGVAAR